MSAPNPSFQQSRTSVGRGSRRSVRSRGNGRHPGLYEFTVSEAAFIGSALFSNGWCPRTGRRSVYMAPPLVQKLYLIDNSLRMKKMFSTSESYWRIKREASCPAAENELHGTSGFLLSHTLCQGIVIWPYRLFTYIYYI